MVIWLRFLFSLSSVAALPATQPSPDYSIENSTIATSPADWHFAQSRAALLPVNPPRIVITTQQIQTNGPHDYRDLLLVQSSDFGGTWSPPTRIESLARRHEADNTDRVIGDPCPQWHAATHKLLVTGKTFGFRDGATEDRSLERVAYAVYDPATDRWSDLHTLTLPPTDHANHPILEPNAGCCQRVDLPDGQTLLPVRYRASADNPAYTSTVARCRFDGATLTYLDHGSELTIARDRGLYEPSLCHFANRFFLTMRADHAGFVSASDDGLHFSEPREWTFDDGQPLGSYNAQQHWLVHGDQLYLAYSRRDASNANVFRSRAPLFIAQIDPQRLCVLRSTERVLMPNTGLDLSGGFGVAEISPTEIWVTNSELNYPKNRANEPNHILLARIRWPKSNEPTP